ncbi:hypothetical protein [Sphingopyxis sp. 550A]
MITLPDAVVPNGIDIALIDFGGILRPPLGGPIQRVNRLGNRFRASVSLPPIPNAELGRVVVSRLIRAKTEGIRLELPLASVDQGSPGNPLINGAGQTGSAITVDGLRPGYGYSEGFWLNIVTGGRFYLYNVAGSGKANGSGQATIPIAPALRKSPADNDAIHLQKPMIEGFVIGDEVAWSISLAHHIGISFEIEEAA